MWWSDEVGCWASSSLEELTTTIISTHFVFLSPSLTLHFLSHTHTHKLSLLSQSNTMCFIGMAAVQGTASPCVRLPLIYWLGQDSCEWNIISPCLMPFPYQEVWALCGCGNSYCLSFSCMDGTVKKLFHFDRFNTWFLWGCPPDSCWGLILRRAYCLPLPTFLLAPPPTPTPTPPSHPTPP